MYVPECMVCPLYTRLKYDSRFSISLWPLLFCTSSLFSAVLYRPLSGWKEAYKTGSHSAASKHVLCECHLALVEQWTASPGIAFALLSVYYTNTLGYILTYNKVTLTSLIWKGIRRKKSFCWPLIGIIITYSKSVQFQENIVLVMRHYLYES